MGRLIISCMCVLKHLTAWSMFTAATMTDNNVRDAIVGQLWKYAARNASGTIFPSNFALNGLNTAAINDQRCV